MATKQEFTMVLNAKLQVAEMNQALKSFQSNLNGLKLPDSLFKSTTKDIEKLQSHLKDFEVLTSKTSFNNSDVNQILSLYGKIGNEVKALGIDLKSLGNIDLQKLMPPDVLQRFQKLGQLLDQIQGQIDFKSSIPDQLKDLGAQADEAKSKIKDLENELQQLNNKKNTISSNLASNQTEQRQTRDEIDLLEKRQKAFVDSRAKNSETIKKNQLELNKLQAQAEKLRIQIETLKKQIPASRGAIQTAQREGALEKAKVDLKSTEDEIKRIQSEQRSLRAQKEPTSTKEYQDRQKQIENLIQKLNELKQKEKELGQGQKTNNKDIDSKTKEYEAQKQVLDEINQKIQQLNTSNADTSKIEEIRQSLADLLGIDISKIPQDLEKLKELTSTLSADQLEQVKTVLKSLGVDVENLGKAYNKTAGEIDKTKQKQQEFNNTNRDIDAFKSRIKYLLGLNNVINLIRRGIRSAFNTIKELDKAMTETAVVTDMTVSDMWAKLPEYTARANKLGISTLEAYQAATLYYQQGLNDTQVSELSVETLRMARIAGLEAAEATDRMTNALRGFNMELNATNAQRVDDVYSKLAAMSASNVDEISTAMTKVASLAHNANMDFETTAAFLAQIIETTRESAETAGTALKTVVARFSEVKKLVTEDQIKGQDEEGQVIDVNKVSAALRTAGIDLNKYFLGEVGLDDIFMELASKWDSLTSVQQRYIATQAAGSRQQSRFIAMMQDYARTQELVSAAYNANGASAEQFEKTQDSLQSKLARLKNAWDEFLMGITNSSLIKVVVDALTLLLNIVNKLTTGFGILTGSVGGFISGLLKLSTAVLALKGLRTIFKTGGVASKLFAGFGQTRLGGFLGFGTTLETSAAAAGASLKTGGAVAAERFVAGASRAAIILAQGAAGAKIPVRGKIGAGGTYRKIPAPTGEVANYGLTGGIGLLTKVGNSKLGTAYASTSLGKWLGGKFALGGVGKAAAGAAIPAQAGAAVGAAGAGAALIATLGAVAVAAGVAYIAIRKLWYEKTPAYQLKVAKKYAEALKKVSENAKKVASEMKEAKTKTEDYEKQISEATNRTDRQKLIQEQNEYIVSLMEQDERYAKYVKTSFEGGQLRLIIDQESFSTAVEEAENAATRASAITNIANADVQEKQIAILEGRKLKDVDLENRTYTGTDLEIDEGDEDHVQTVEVTRTMSDRQYAQQLAIQAQIDAAEASAQAYRATAISQYASTYSDQASGEVLDLISNALAESMDWSAIDSAVESRRTQLVFASDAAMEQRYYDLYGIKLEAGYDKDEAKRQIAFGEVLQETLDSYIPDFIDIAQDTNGKMILQVLAGAYEGNEQAIQEAITAITENDQYANAFAKLLGIEVSELQDKLTTTYDNLMAEQESLRAGLTSKLLRTGMGAWAQIRATVDGLNIKQVRQLNKYTDKFTNNYGKNFSRAILAQITQSMSNGEWEGSYLQQFVDKNLTGNLVLDYQNLNKWAELTGNATEYEREMRRLSKAYLLLADSEETFSRENLTQWFFMSDEYDNLTEQIDKFIEENGQINSHNVEELAKSNATLQALLDANILGANGLAAAINALSKGNIGVNDLTEDVLELFDAFDMTANAVQRAGYYIKNFDAGEDYGDAIDFINSGIEQMQELLNNGEIGNPQLLKYIEDFFGVTPDPHNIEEWQHYIDILKGISGNQGANFWTDYVGFSRNGNYINMDTSGFAEAIARGDVSNYRDYIRSLVEANGGPEFTDEFYDLMIRNAQNHNAGAFEQIAEIELNKLLDAYQNKTPTKADIQAIADAYGLDPEELYQAWREKYGGASAPRLYEELEEQRPRSSTTSMEDQLEWEDYSQIYNPEYDVYTLDPMQAFMQKYGVDKTGHFSIDHLYAKIGEIVPEVAEGSITPQEWLQEQIDKYGGEDGKVTIPVTAQVMQWVDDGNGGGSYQYVDVEFEITGATPEELEASYYAGLERASQENLYGPAVESLGSTLAETTKKAISQGALKAFAELTIPTLTIPLQFNEASATIEVGGGTIQVSVKPSVANGGIVKSAAGGTIEPGLALTGEEVPEIVWNKEKGYAYLTGKNGPEIQNLQPGDQVFDGEQTRQILKRSGISSFAKGTIPSYARRQFEIIDGELVETSKGTGKRPNLPKNDTTEGSTYWTDGKDGNGSGGSSKSSKDWKNELDWLYDLMEDIAEEEHKQTLIQSEYELAEKDLTKTGRDLFNLTKAELETLNSQLEAQQFAYEKRLQQMNELQQKVVAEGFEEYLRWNGEDNTLEIDWDKINEISDKDTYDKLSDLVSDMEKVQDQMDEAQKATLDIKKQIQELQTRYLQAYLDFQDKVKEAVVAQYQQVIDNLSTLNDTINDANQSILDSIQKEIDLQRQIRDNTDTEKEIADMEARLAILQRDTTGANQQEILELQKQLDEARKNYSDTLIDQAIDRLSQNNDEAQEQREKQIELLEAQLEYWQETGALWEEVAELIASGFTAQGSIIEDSALWEILKDKDSWNGLSQAQKENWANELILEGAQVGAYLTQLNDGVDVSTDRIIDSIIGEHGLAGEITAETRIVRAQLNELIAKLGGTPIDSIPGEGGYASGGLATKTGYAMLHGTANEPEYVLNARQTDAFLRLTDVLPSIFGSGTGTTNNYGTNVYVELNMSVGEIGSDYDVDRLVARVKDDIYDASSYRNVNAVSFLR